MLIHVECGNFRALLSAGSYGRYMYSHCTTQYTTGGMTQLPMASVDWLKYVIISQDSNRFDDVGFWISIKFENPQIRSRFKAQFSILPPAPANTTLVASWSGSVTYWSSVWRQPIFWRGQHVSRISDCFLLDRSIHQWSTFKVGSQKVIGWFFRNCTSFSFASS